jgi:hypothetical protein
MEFIVHEGDDDDDMVMEWPGFGGPTSPKEYAKGKKSKVSSPAVSSPASSSPGVSRGTRAPSPLTLKADYSMNYSMDYRGRIPNLETEIEIYKMIIDMESKSWIGGEEDDEHDFLYAIQEGPNGTNYFIKKFDDRSAFLWERESKNLKNLMECYHVPIFYCSLSNEKKNEFFIITEKCEEFDKRTDKPLLKELPDYLDDFHSLDYFHGDLGNPENIMVAIREGHRELVFIDLDDTYSLEKNHTKDTEPTEGKPLSRDDKISAFKFVETDNPEVDEKRDIFMACDRFSLMHSLLTLLGLKELLPGSGVTIIYGGEYKGRNCLLPGTHPFYSVFLPNTKVVSGHMDCKKSLENIHHTAATKIQAVSRGKQARERISQVGRQQVGRGSIDLEIIGDGNIFWNFVETIKLVDFFNRCYDIFKVNLRRGRDPFDGVDVILQEIGAGVEPEGEVEAPQIASMKSSFARKKSKKKKTNRKNKKLNKSRRKTNRKNKKLKTKKSRKKTKRKYKR